MLRLDKTICGDLNSSLSREWLETNGLGGFACGTVGGANTRRYHGLLTAALNPPGGRTLLLSKLEDTLVVGEKRIDLSTNEYSTEGVIHPEGYQHLVEFRQDPFPTFTFEAEGVRIEKSIFMHHGGNTTQVEYKLLDAPKGIKVELELRPLIAFRDYHSTTHENGALNPEVQSELGLVSFAPYAGLPRLYLAHNASAVAAESHWYRNFFFRIEHERGLDAQEDLFNPAVLGWELKKGQSAVVIASVEKYDITNAIKYRRAELQRREAIVAKAPADDPMVQALALAADQYLVKRGDHWTVMAGYPWFTDWGRDTMISLPGLTLFTGNGEIARDILLNFAGLVDVGMLPNRFAEDGEVPEYNTVDATLWFFEAARAYAAATGDYDFLRDELYSIFVRIIDAHIKGTRYNIHMMENGLLNAGESGAQLTWMDAKIGDWVVTPRMGKPVEIQALWFNALKIMEDLAGRFDRTEDQRRFGSVASLASWTFNRIFWNKDRNCLYDVTNGGPSDGSLRPNQIFAVSLRYPILTGEKALAVVETVERELLTSVGLRTLDRQDPRYRPIYQDDQYSRDSAYHQGTVWPWLLGPFVTAYVRVHGGTPEARQRASEILHALEPHLSEACLGQISEIFDADEPHQPRGCFAQAWSVAEVLRALCEDVYQIRPMREEIPAAVAR
jgi:predicted glycogen debranching enzyme